MANREVATLARGESRPAGEVVSSWAGLDDTGQPLPSGAYYFVLDVDSGKTVGEIPGTEGVHGIALAPDLHRGFTSNGRSSTVTTFDTGTLAVVGSVKATGDNPDAIIYDPASHRVFAFNGRGKNVTCVDPSTLEVKATVALEGQPEAKRHHRRHTR